MTTVQRDSVIMVRILILESSRGAATRTTVLLPAHPLQQHSHGRSACSVCCVPSEPR